MESHQDMLVFLNNDDLLLHESVSLTHPTVSVASASVAAAIQPNMDAPSSYTDTIAVSYRTVQTGSSDTPSSHTLSFPTTAVQRTTPSTTRPILSMGDDGVEALFFVHGDSNNNDVMNDKHGIEFMSDEEEEEEEEEELTSQLVELDTLEEEEEEEEDDLDDEGEDEEVIEVESLLDSHVTLTYPPVLIHKSIYQSSYFTNEKSIIYFPSDDETIGTVPATLQGKLGFKMVLKRSGFKLFKRGKSWLGCWGKHFTPDRFKKLKSFQKVNHFPMAFELGRKDRLYQGYARMMEKYGKQEYNFMPETYILPMQYRKLRSKFANNSLWIIKPVASARGNGVRLISKVKEIPKKKELIVSRYIHNPFLIKGRKFDLRVYVLVTSFDPLRFYIYDNGVVRFASEVYNKSTDRKQYRNRYVHLTNWSINKKRKKGPPSAEAPTEPIEDDPYSVAKGKWSFDKFRDYMVNVEHQNPHKIFNDIHAIIIKTMASGHSSNANGVRLYAPFKDSCYELYGFDILLDDQLKPWLMEVNISPALKCVPSDVDYSLKLELIREMFNCVGFKAPKKPVKSDENESEAPNLSKPKASYKNLDFDIIFSSTDPLTFFLDKLQEEDVQLLKDVEDENMRRGRFKLLIPSSRPSDYTTLSSSCTIQDRILHIWWRLKSEFDSKLCIDRLKHYVKSESGVDARRLHSLSTSSPRISTNSQNPLQKKTIHLSHGNIKKSTVISHSLGNLDTPTYSYSRKIVQFSSNSLLPPPKATITQSAPNLASKTNSSPLKPSLIKLSLGETEKTASQQAPVYDTTQYYGYQSKSPTPPQPKQSDNDGLPSSRPSSSCSVSRVSIKPTQVSFEILATAPGACKQQRSFPSGGNLIKEGHRSKERVASQDSLLSIESYKSDSGAAQQILGHHPSSPVHVAVATEEAVIPESLPANQEPENCAVEACSDTESDALNVDLVIPQHVQVKQTVFPMATVDMLGKQQRGKDSFSSRKSVAIPFNMGPCLVSKTLHMNTAHRLKQYKQVQSLLKGVQQDSTHTRLQSSLSSIPSDLNKSMNTISLNSMEALLTPASVPSIVKPAHLAQPRIKPPPHVLKAYKKLQSPVLNAILQRK